MPPTCSLCSSHALATTTHCHAWGDAQASGTATDAADSDGSDNGSTGSRCGRGDATLTALRNPATSGSIRAARGVKQRRALGLEFEAPRRSRTSSPSKKLPPAASWWEVMGGSAPDTNTSNRRLPQHGNGRVVDHERSLSVAITPNTTARQRNRARPRADGKVSGTARTGCMRAAVGRAGDERGWAVVARQARPSVRRLEKRG